MTTQHSAQARAIPTKPESQNSQLICFDEFVERLRRARLPIRSVGAAADDGIEHSKLHSKKRVRDVRDTGDDAHREMGQSRSIDEIPDQNSSEKVAPKVKAG